jgi:S-DNA-T family DNA segregation ATPase FtsK/SpoIIIE
MQRLRELGTPGVLLSGSKDEGALLGGVKPSPRPPGQGQYIGRRGDASVIQVAWLTATEETTSEAVGINAPPRKG